MRRPTGVRIARDKLTGLVVALACLAFSAIGLAVNDPPDFSYVDGRRGEPVAIEGAELTVGDVQVGTRLLDDGAVEAETSGMFVVVDVSLAVPGPRRVTLNKSQLVTADRTYSQWSSTSPRAEPGFENQEQLVFEVDPAQIDDLSLEIWYAGLLYGYYERARIHLGITSANAEAWRQAARGRNLQDQNAGSTSALP